MADLVAIGYPDETTAMAIGAGMGALMGKVSKTSLSKEDEKELQDALHGDETAAR